MSKLKDYLQDLENRIDVADEERLLEETKKFCDGRWEEEIFSPKRKATKRPSIKWPSININDAIQDDELMLIREFSGCSNGLKECNGRIMTVRSNYGVAILALLFGVEQFIMPYEMNTLPICRSFKNPIDDVKRCLDKGIPDLSGGWGEKVFAMGERFMEIKKNYPNIAKCVHIEHPDCQGPMDICDLLWGSELFYVLYDYPDLVSDFLKLITQTYKLFLDKWFQIVPKTKYSAHGGMMYKGTILVRDDSAMNLSPDMYAEFIYPYNDECLNYFGSGAIHYCGRGEHFVPIMSKMKSLNAINLSQPHLNDMETIFKNTVDKGIPIIGLKATAVKQALEQNRPLRGLVSTYDF